MKAPCIVFGLMVVCWTGGAVGQDDPIKETFREALFAEEAERDLEAAIEGYEATVAAFDRHRDLAATALFRLAECQRKLGQDEAAAASYQRVLAEFPDQEVLVKLSGENLAALGIDAPGTPAGPSVPGDEESREIVALREMLAQSPDLLDQPVQDGKTRLHLAAEKGQIRLAEALLDAGIDIDLKAVDGSTPLEEASENGHLAMVKLLLERGADPDTPDAKASALTEAAARGHRAVFDALVAAGAKERRPEERLVTPIAAAASHGDPEFLRHVIGSEVDNIATAHSQREPALFGAVSRGQAEIVGVLLEAGADPDAGPGVTPLANAVASARADIARMLVEAGADPDLKASDEQVFPLILAILGGDADLVSLLLEAGADPAVEADEGVPALVLAVQKQMNPATIRSLIEHGAKVDHADERGTTALLMAISMDDFTTAEALLELGADPDHADAKGHRPLHWAVTRPAGKPMVDMLLEAGADPDGRVLGRGDAGVPAAPAQTKVRRPRVIEPPEQNARNEVIQRLLRRAKDSQVTVEPPRPADTTTARGDTPLTFGISHSIDDNLMGTVESLLEAGADVNAEGSEDNFRRSPLLMAVAKEGARRGDLVGTLLDAGAEVLASDNAGRTALDVLKESQLAGVLDEPWQRRLWEAAYHERPDRGEGAWVSVPGSAFQKLEPGGRETVLRAFVAYTTGDNTGDFDVPSDFRLARVYRVGVADLLEVDLIAMVESGDQSGDIGLQAGDIVEIPANTGEGRFKVEGGYHVSSTSEFRGFREQARNLLEDRITLQIGEAETGVAHFPYRYFDGQRLLDPVARELAGRRDNASRLAGQVYAALPGIDAEAAVLHRGFDGEMIPLGAEESADGVVAFHGDRIVYPLLPPDALERRERRDGVIAVARPADLFHAAVAWAGGGMIEEMPDGVRWDIVLAETYGMQEWFRRFVLPSPDFGAVRILHLDGTVVTADPAEPFGFARSHVVPWGAVVEIPEVPDADLAEWTGLDDAFREAVENDHAIGVTVLIDDVTPTPYALTAVDFARYERTEDHGWKRYPWRSPNAFDAKTVELQEFLKKVNLYAPKEFNLEKVGIVSREAKAAYESGDAALARFVRGTSSGTPLHDGDTILLRRKASGD